MFLLGVELKLHWNWGNVVKPAFSIREIPSCACTLQDAFVSAYFSSTSPRECPTIDRSSKFQKSFSNFWVKKLEGKLRIKVFAARPTFYYSIVDAPNIDAYLVFLFSYLFSFILKARAF